MYDTPGDQHSVLIVNKRIQIGLNNNRQTDGHLSSPHFTKQIVQRIACSHDQKLAALLIRRERCGGGGWYCDGEVVGGRCPEWAVPGTLHVGIVGIPLHIAGV